MQAQTSYTIADLKKSSTARLIRIYERVTGRSAWDVYFNPYMERQMLIIAIPKSDPINPAIKPHKALVLTVTPKGFSILWTNEQEKNARRSISDDSIRMMRKLRADDESYTWLGEQFNMKASMVGKICRGERFAEVI